MKKILALVLVLLLAVSACAMAETVKIGVFEPLSGDSGAGGKQEVLGMQYANSQVPTVEIGGETIDISCVTIGNPHCIVFIDNIDSVDLNAFGDKIRNSGILPEYINTGIVRMIDKNTIKLRCYERAVNGESLGCGTSAAAAVVIATEMGLCTKGEDVTVKMPGGDVVITYTDETILVNGDTKKIYEGVVEY